MLKKQIWKKLKSEKGTSIFFGLLLFLAASILSVVILNGAVTTVKTVTSDRKAEQNQLTCTSVAQLLRDSITNVKLSAKVTVTKDKKDNIQNTTKDWQTPAVSGTGLETPVELANWLQDYLKAIDNKNKNDTAIVPSITKKMILETNGSGTDLTQFNELGKVNAEFTITPQKSNDKTKPNEVTYDIVVKLSTGENRDSSHVVLSLTGKVNAVELPTEGTDTDQVSTKVTRYDYTWEAKDIIYGDSERTLGDSK